MRKKIKFQWECVGAREKILQEFVGVRKKKILQEFVGEKEKNILNVRECGKKKNHENEVDDKTKHNFDDIRFVKETMLN